MTAEASNTRPVYVDNHADSRMWEHFSPRPGDIAVVTPPKSGTTWTQAVVALLLSGDPQVNVDPSTNAPWIDASKDSIDEVMAGLEARSGRRHVKTHTPFDGFAFSPEMTYLCVYRHPIDVYFSWRKHERNMKFDIDGLPFNEDPRAGFREFLETAYRGTSGAALPMVLKHYKCSLALADKPNVLMLHYADMTRDLAGVMARVAKQLGIVHPPEVMASLVEAASFDNMKANAGRFVPGANRDVWRQDADFFHSATSNKWEGRLEADDLAAYDVLMREALTPDERKWLEWGSGRA
ncbi:MAG: sulfotransferase domain-containing protein [Silicimonas sp.]|jgi:aryl sulfotransferase|nr:sulfotransferase domain-containing protein [Silicimonas sp.]